MRASDFKRWRKALGLSQKQAADALGLKRRMVQYYEKGERDGEKVSVPKTVRLACWALISGMADYHGPDPKQDADTGAGGNRPNRGANRHMDRHPKPRGSDSAQSGPWLAERIEYRVSQPRSQRPYVFPAKPVLHILNQAR